MATTKYGAYCATDDYRVKMVYSQTASATQYSFTVDCYAEFWQGYQSGYSSSAKASVKGSASSWSGTLSVNSGATSNKLCTKSLAVTRTHAAQSVALSASFTSYAGTSTASASVTVPALDSYAVSYDANGGTGAPTSQTKWHGEALTLSTASPTRSNYNFRGWSTSRTATTPDSAYTAAKMAAGASYTANAALTLYAVWELALVVPTIGSLAVYRTSGANATLDDEGTNAYVSCAWSVDTATNGSSNKGKTLAVSYRERGASAWTAALSTSLSAASATTGASVRSTASGNALVAFDAARAYEVQVTVTDAVGASASRTLTLSPASFAIDVGNSGKSVAFGAAASDSASECNIALPPKHYGRASLPTFTYSSKPAESAVPCKPCIVVLTTGAAYLYT